MQIILADAELELLPEEFKSDENVRRFLKGIGKETVILDNHQMRESIRRHTPDQLRRSGFPHIAYAFVRMNEESVLNGKTKLNYAIHTKHDVIVESSDLRGIGAGYLDFVERIEEILQGEPRRRKLLDYIEESGNIGNTVVLHPRGKPGLVVNDQSNYVIGGFPEGDFRSELGNMRRFSIYDSEITVPGVLELLHFRLLNSL